MEIYPDIPKGIITSPEEVILSVPDIIDFMDEQIILAISYNEQSDLDVVGVRDVRDMAYYIGYLGMTNVFDYNIDVLIRGNVYGANELPYELKHDQVAGLFYETWFFQLFSDIEELTDYIEMSFESFGEISIKDFTIVIGKRYTSKVLKTVLKMSKKYKEKANVERNVFYCG